MKSKQARVHAFQVLLPLFIALASSLSLKAQSWGDSQSSGCRESASASMFRPGRYAFDGNNSTYWQLSNGSTEGWVESCTASALRYAGATINAAIPSGARLTLSVLTNGSYLAIPGGVITGPMDDTTALVFPGELPPTTRVLARLEGENAAQARIYEIKLEESSAPTPYGKIIPKSYTTNFSEYINIKASRLWNGINNSDWFEPLWSLPGEPFQTDNANKPTAIFPPYLGNPPVGVGQIVWQLDGTYQIQTLKVYQINSGRWVRFEFWVNGKWTNAEDIKNQWTTGWQRLSLSNPVTTNQIRISFPGGWEQARYIGQIQVWGQGWSDAPTRPLALAPAGSDGYQQFTLDDVAKRNYRLSATIPGTKATSLSGEWNGNSITLEAVAEVSGSTLFQAPIPAPTILSGQQYLKIATGGNTTGVSFDVGEETGRISLGSPWDNGYFDQSDSASENPKLTNKSWNLGGAYQLERLRVYMKGANAPVFQIALGRSKRTVSWTSAGSGWWEADLGGEVADTLDFSSVTAVSIDQIQLYGTPLNDSNVDIELWWPQSSSSKPVTSNGLDGNSIIGWMGSPSVQPTINGYHPRQADKLFWMPLGQMGMNLGGRYALSTSGTLGGVTTQVSNILCWWLGTQASLTQGTSLATTTNDHLTLSGTDALWGTYCFIGGTEVPVSGGKYSYSAPLSCGYQVIPVEIRALDKKTVLASWQKPVYRSSADPVIAFDLPNGDLWTQSSTMQLSGRVGNGPGLGLSLNGNPLSLTGDAYQGSISLKEGAQTLAFALTDSLGRQTTRNLLVNRDSTPPAIAIISPTAGQYIASPGFNFIVSGGIDNQLWWSFNGDDWEAGIGNPEVVPYTLADGFYTYRVQAQDRAGNLSAIASVSFCIDTTPPAAFAIGSNVTGWTNNSQPTLSFSTTDATSGIDHYLCSVDGGEPAIARSPYQLPKVLSDGTHTVTVTAYDKAGNSTIESISLQIDTTPPTAVQNLQVIPGDNQISVSWSAITTDLSGVASYSVKRSPDWSDGTHSLTTTSFVDTAAVNGTSYNYTVWAIDMAGNIGATNVSESISAGLAISPVIPTAPTAITFNNLLVQIPAGALASDITQVLAGEIPKTDLCDTPEHAIVSSIYSFAVTRVDNGIASQTDHADLSSNASMRIWYDVSQIPKGMTEANLKPYYYDTVWGRWISLPASAVDTASHSIMFNTNHFSDYCVQASPETELCAEQILTSGISPLSTAIGQAPVVVSPASGITMTTFTETVLPGINQFDLVVARTYDSATAQSDASGISAGSDGSYPWYMGQGWRLGFPYVKWNDSGLWLRDLDGHILGYDQMTIVGSAQSGDTLTITMENHEGSDETLVATFLKHKETKRVSWWETETTLVYKFDSAKLFMKDGREADFNSQGRVRKIFDGSHVNTIEFAYPSSSATTITQNLPQGQKRVLSIAYDGTNPQIRSITINGGSKSLVSSYGYSGNELTSATDIGGRIWSYGYKDFILSSSLTAQTKGYANCLPTCSTISLLSMMKGPGIGYVTVDYSSIDNTYSNIYQYKDESVAYSIGFNRFYAGKISTALDNASAMLRATNYTYSIKAADKASSAGANQYYTDTVTIDDGRMIRETKYSSDLRPRTRLSQSPEAIQEALSSSTVGSWLNCDTVIAISPQSTLYISATKTPVEKQNQTWDPVTLCVTNETWTRGSNVKGIAYSYDHGWGNVTKIIETASVGSRTTARTTTMAYYNNSATAIPGVPGNSSLPSSLSVSLSYYQKNLMAEKVTEIQGSDSQNAKIPSEDLFEYEVYQYYDNTNSTTQGLLAKKERWTGSSWAATSYSYDGNAELTKVEGPRLKTEYSYIYNANSGENYTTTQQDSIQLDSANAAENILTVQGYDFLSGNDIWSIDSRGYCTYREYDNLNRTTKIIEPIDGDTPWTKSTPVPPSGSAFPDSISSTHPCTKISYSDSIGYLSSEVTTPLGAKVTQKFDDMGRLASIKKQNANLSSLASKSTETIATMLTYDGYDELITASGPLSSLETGATVPITTYTYDARGRMASVKYPGATSPQASNYDDSTNTVVITDELGNARTQLYDWAGRVLSQSQTVSGKLYTTNSYYDGAGRVIASEDANSNLATITYNSLGLKARLVGQKRPVTVNGTTTTVAPQLDIAYNDDGTVKQTTQAMDEGGSRVSVFATNALGEVLDAGTSVAVNGTLTNIRTKNIYDHGGNIIYQTSGYDEDFAAGTTRTMAWTYDSHARVLTRTTGSGDSGSETMRYTYDAVGNRTSVTDPRQAYTLQNGGNYSASFVLTLKYDQLGRLSEADLPASANISETPKIEFLYDGRGNLLERKEADGEIHKYAYTPRSLLSASIVTDGTTSYTTAYDYYDTGWLKNVTSPSKRVDELYYDEAGRVIKMGNAVVGYTQRSYDGNGNVLAQIDGNNHATSYTYSPDNLAQSMTDAKGGVTTASYDRWGQELQTADANGNTRTYAYDILGRLIAESTPWDTGSAPNIHYSYDAWGNIVSNTDARGTVFNRVFNAENHLASQTAMSADGKQSQTTSYAYDEGGGLRSSSSSNGVQTSYNSSTGSYQADPYGLTTGKADTVSAASIAMAFGYDIRQRIKEITYPDSSGVSYAYNTLDQLKNITDTSGSAIGSVTYDSYGRVQSLGLANGVGKSFIYDDQDRLAGLSYSEKTGDLVSYSYTYDLASNIRSKNANTYNYDELNQLVGTTENGWFQQKPDYVKPTLTTQDRDYDGTTVLTFNAQETLEENESSVITLDMASRSVGIDLGTVYGVNKIELHPQNATTRVRQQDIMVFVSSDNQATSNSTVADYEPVTGWTMTTKGDGSLTLTFPKIFQARYIKINTIWDDRDIANASIGSYATFSNTARDLVKVWVLSQQQSRGFAYDAIGNITSETVDSVTRTSSYYKNPKGGNLSWLRYDGTWYYEYDQAGNRTLRAKALLAGTLGSEAPDTSQEYWTYSWDLYNRLVGVSKNGEQVAAYTYDAENFRVQRIGSDGTTIYGYDRNAALAYQKNLTTGLTRTINYANGQIIGWVDTQGAASARYYAVTDHLGSVTEVTDASGKVVWQSEYTPYGEVAGAQGSYDFSGMFAGQDIDPDTRLTYHWNRWRSEDGTRWLSEDPIQAGINFYGYCGNNPMGFVDPWGLVEVMAHEAHGDITEHDKPNGERSYTDRGTGRSFSGKAEHDTAGKDYYKASNGRYFNPETGEYGKLVRTPGGSGPSSWYPGSPANTKRAEVLPDKISWAPDAKQPYKGDTTRNGAKPDWADGASAPPGDPEDPLEKEFRDMSPEQKRKQFVFDCNFFLFLIFLPVGPEAGGVVEGVGAASSEAGGATKLIEQISTGRTVPNSLTEQLAMEEATSNPAGTVIERITMSDPRFPAADGWVKMQQEVNGVIIHYTKNLHTGAVADFKFIKP